jgi:hypothetical protein
MSPEQLAAVALDCGAISIRSRWSRSNLLTGKLPFTAESPHMAR